MFDFHHSLGKVIKLLVSKSDGIWQDSPGFIVCNYILSQKYNKIQLLTAMWGHQHSCEQKHDHGSRANSGILASAATASWERSQRNMASVLSETMTRDPTGAVCPVMQCKKKRKPRKCLCPSFASSLISNTTVRRLCSLFETQFIHL